MQVRESSALHHPVRALLYISDAAEMDLESNLPLELASVVISARKNNPKHQITGFLSFGDGKFLQVIEGAPKQVARLMRNIRKDTRHQHIRVLLDVRLPSRHFPNWSSLLATSGGEHPEFVQFLEQRFGWNFPQEPSALEIIQKLHEKAHLGEQSSGFSHLLVSLYDWPRFDQIPPTRALLGLCALLAKGQQPYTFLVENTEYRDYNALDKDLFLLQSKGLLHIELNQSIDDAAFVNKQSDSTRRGFFQRMRNFLSRVNTTA